MVGLNCRSHLGAVAPANAGRGWFCRCENARLDRLPHVVLHARGAHHSEKTSGQQTTNGATKAGDNMTPANGIAFAPGSIRQCSIPGGRVECRSFLNKSNDFRSLGVCNGVNRHKPLGYPIPF